MKAFAPAEKVGIIATVTPEGLPHMSLLTSVMAPEPATAYRRRILPGHEQRVHAANRKIGFAILTLDKKLWRGKALWTHLKKEGPEYEIYNQQPMFRYNTYFGINTVHYFDLKETTAGAPLPLASIVKSALLTKMAKGGAAKGKPERVLSYFGEKLFNGLDSLKFLSFIADDGFPVIIPVIQCQAAGQQPPGVSSRRFSARTEQAQTGNDGSCFWPDHADGGCSGAGDFQRLFPLSGHQAGHAGY